MTGLFDPLEQATFGKAAPTVEQITKVFNHYDTGNTGSLSPYQVLTACQAITNIGFTTTELKSYVKEGLDVAGDTNGKIKLSVFASYLAFEAAKKYKNTNFSKTIKITVKTETYDNPFLDLFETEPSLNAVNNNLDTPPSQQRASMKGSLSPTVAANIPDWFGMSIADQTDPFGTTFPEKGELTTSVSLDTAAHLMGVAIDSFVPNKGANQLRTQSGGVNDDLAHIFGGNHLSFPSRDILFSDDVKTNNNSTSFPNGVSHQRNISPKKAKRLSQKGMLPPPRSKGDVVPHEKHGSHSQTTTPVANFTFADNFDIVQQAQQTIDNDNDDHKREMSESSSSQSPEPQMNTNVDNALLINPSALNPTMDGQKSSRPKSAPASADIVKTKVKRPKIDAIVHMKKGAAMLKYGRRGFPHFRRFQLTDDLTKIIWFSRKKSLNETHICVSDIRDILEGQKTDVFRQCTQRTLEKASFSVIYGSRLKTLDVVAKSAEEAKMWIKGVTGLIKAYNKGKLHKVIQILVDVDFKDITKINYRNCTDEQRRKYDMQFKNRPEMVHTISATLEQSQKAYQNVGKLAQNANVRNSFEWKNINVLMAECEERLQEIGYGLLHKTAAIADLKRDVWVLKVDVTVLEEMIKVLSKVKSHYPI